MCSQIKSQFVKLQEHELDEISRILLQRLPRACQFVNLIRLNIRLDLKKKCSFYKWTGTLDPATAGYVASVSSLNKTYWVILECAIPPSIELMMSDFAVNLVDWKMNGSFNALPVDTFKYLESYCQKLNGIELFVNLGVVQYMPLEVACNLDTSNIPSDVTIRKLEREDLFTVIRNWKYVQHHGEFELIAEAAEAIGSVGIFLKEAGNEKLVSWGLELRDGGIHAVVTLDEYQGRGYGKLIMKHLSKLIAKMDQFPIVHIEDGNAPSIALMSSVGFTFSHDIIWSEFNLIE